MERNVTGTHRHEEFSLNRNVCRLVYQGVAVRQTGGTFRIFLT
jgi:hypothetical protein